MYEGVGSKAVLLERGLASFKEILENVSHTVVNHTISYESENSWKALLERRFSHSNHTFGQLFQMISNLTRMYEDAESRGTMLESGCNHFNRTFQHVFQRIGNLTSMYDTVSSKNADLENAVSGFNQTFEQLFSKINNQSRKPDVAYCSQYPFESKRGGIWLARNADTLSQINNSIVSATIEYKGTPCYQFTVMTNSFGEFYLSLPQDEGYTIIIELAGYHPIILSNFSLGPGAEMTFLEPLLFISHDFAGAGTVNGVVVSIPELGASTKYRGLENADVQFWALDRKPAEQERRNATMKTSATGSWKLTLPTGSYRMKVSESGYITTASTIAVLGAIEKSYGSIAVTTAMDDNSIRVVLCGSPNLNYNLDLHVTGPINGGRSREHVYPAARGSADGLIIHDVDGNGKPYSSTVIKRQLDGIYRFSVYDFDNCGTSDSWALARSRAAVHVYQGSTLWATYYVPNRAGNTWNVVEINGTYLKAINGMRVTGDETNVD